MKRFGFLVIIVLLLVVVVVTLTNTTNRTNQPAAGIGGGPNITQTQDQQQATPQRVALHKILQEHTVTAGLHLQNLYDGKDTTDTKARMNQNSQQFLEEIGKGATATGSLQQLERIWAGHIAEYEAYTNALKNNDIAQIARIRSRLQMHSQEFGNAINTLHPTISVDEATNAMQEHATLTLSVITEHAEGDTAQKATQTAKSSAQAASFAEVLYPDDTTNN